MIGWLVSVEITGVVFRDADVDFADIVVGDGEVAFFDLDFLLFDSFFGFSGFFESVPSLDLDLERFDCFSAFFSDFSLSDFL